MAPESVGPYRIRHKLGSGGMGDVYLAEDTRLGRQVALKSLTEKWARNPDARRRLVHEARAAAGLNHPNVAGIYDVVETAEASWIVMEYAPGETLAASLRRGPLTPEAVVWVGVQICDALGAAHARNIVHRDLKPANLMLSPEGHLKVLDFGLAKSLDLDSGSSAPDASSDDLSGGGRLVGTLPYVPPEHILGERVDERSDIYSAGVVLFELLSGRRPFDHADKKALAQAIVDGDPPDLQALRPEAPEALVKVVKRAMAREPSERPPTAGALRAELGQLSGAQSGWQTITDLHRPLGVHSRSSSSRRRQRRRGRALAAAISTMVALGVYWAFLTFWNKPPAISGHPPVVAVLPLSNASGDLAFDHLAIGFADVIVNALAGLPDVSVVSRSAVMEAREHKKDMAALARELGADLLVDGSVQRSADRVRVAMSVVKARSRVVDWSRVFEGRSDDMLSLQLKVAEAVAQAVKGGRVTAQELERIQRAMPASEAALSKYGEARKLLDRADVTGNVDRALTCFAEALRSEPKFALAEAGLAEAYWAKYMQTKEPRFADAARGALDRALAIAPDQVQVRLALAQHLGKTGKVDEAVTELGRVARLQEGSDEAHRLLGELLQSEGRTEEGLAELRRALALRPDFWKNHDALGLAFFDLGRYQEAATAWGRVTELLPDSSWGYEQLAAALYAAGDRTQAARHYRRAVEIDPSPQAWSALGAIAYAEGRYAEARNDIEAALRLDPRFASGYRNLGDVLARQRDPAGARRSYEKAVELAQELVEVNPANGLTLARLAVYLAKAGRMDKALSTIDEAVRLAPDKVDVQYRMAVVYALSGRPAEARVALDRALVGGYSRALARDDEDVAFLLPEGSLDAAGRPRSEERRSQ